MTQSRHAGGPTHHPEVERFAEGRITLEELRERLARRGTPLLAPVEDPARGKSAAVTFVVIDDANECGAIFRLRTLIDRALPGDARLSRIRESAVHALTLRLPSDLRFSYAFERSRPGGALDWVDDPWNRRPSSGDERLGQPVAVLPDAVDLPVLERVAERSVPPVAEVMIDSVALGEQRRVWVSEPSGETRGELPLVIVFDGTAEHCAPLIRDALVDEDAVVPMLVVLVDQMGRRNRDLTGHGSFSRFLVQELLPVLRTRFGASCRPGEVVLSGSSFGGLCAGWTALNHPESFGGAILQSPSCWHHPDLPSDAAALDSLRPAPTPTLISAFDESPPAPIRIFHEVGRLEFGPPPAQVWQVQGNRWLHRVLTAHGYDTVYREFAGGHDAAWWRGTWADALAWHFAADLPRGGRT